MTEKEYEEYLFTKAARLERGIEYTPVKREKRKREKFTPSPALELTGILAAFLLVFGGGYLLIQYANGYTPQGSVSSGSGSEGSDIVQSTDTDTSGEEAAEPAENCWYAHFDDSTYKECDDAAVKAMISEKYCEDGKSKNVTGLYLITPGEITEKYGIAVYNCSYPMGIYLTHDGGVWLLDGWAGVYFMLADQNVDGVNELYYTYSYKSGLPGFGGAAFDLASHTGETLYQEDLYSSVLAVRYSGGIQFVKSAFDIDLDTTDITPVGCVRFSSGQFSLISADTGFATWMNKAEYEVSEEDRQLLTNAFANEISGSTLTGLSATEIDAKLGIKLIKATDKNGSGSLYIIQDGKARLITAYNGNIGCFGITDLNGDGAYEVYFTLSYQYSGVYGGGIDAGIFDTSDGSLDRVNVYGFNDTDNGLQIIGKYETMTVPDGESGDYTEFYLGCLYFERIGDAMLVQDFSLSSTAFPFGATVYYDVSSQTVKLTAASIVYDAESGSFINKK